MRIQAQDQQSLSKALATSREVTFNSVLDGGKVKVEFYNDGILTDGDRSKHAIKSLKLNPKHVNLQVYFSVLSAESANLSLTADVPGIKQGSLNRTPIESTVWKYKASRPSEDWKALDCESVEVGAFIQSPESPYFTGSPREIFAKFGGADGVPASVWVHGKEGYKDCSENAASSGKIVMAASQSLTTLKIKKPQNASGSLGFYIVGPMGSFELKSKFVSSLESTTTIDPTTTPTPVPTAPPNLLKSVKDLALGQEHTCALLLDGGVKCWGNNLVGQLGDNSTTDRRIPAAVSGLSSGVSSIASGGSRTCAVMESGALKCWGSNSRGQLGDNSKENRLAPVFIGDLLTKFSNIFTGNYHTCAVLAGGGAKCWGRNDGFQLGDNSDKDRLFPVDVSGLASGVSSLSVGNLHTCASLTNGSAKCWGSNNDGQLGNNSTGSGFPVPVDVFGLSTDAGVASVSSGGDHSCALFTSGGVKCWGDNSYGQLGDSTDTDRSTPVTVQGLESGVSAISAGGNHNCALLKSGSVKCWGSGVYGQLGNNSKIGSNIPVDVLNLSEGVVKIKSGGYHTCALLTTGSIKCWGRNSRGQVTQGDVEEQLIPIDVLEN